MRRKAMRDDDGWWDAGLHGLGEGVYRVTVFGAGTIEPVTDLVSVAGS